MTCVHEARDSARELLICHVAGDGTEMDVAKVKKYKRGRPAPILVVVAEMYGRLAKAMLQESAMSYSYAFGLSVFTCALPVKGAQKR